MEPDDEKLFYMFCQYRCLSFRKYDKDLVKDIDFTKVLSHVADIVSDVSTTQQIALSI